MVYLLHLSSPFWHVRHYVGFAESERTFEQRLAHHRAGSGARLMRAVAAAGIDFEVARVWKDGDRSWERKLHNYHKTRMLCPLCSFGAALKRMQGGGA